MQHLQYPILGSSEEIKSEFESKWLDDFGCIHCHNFSDWSLTVLTYSVLVVSLGSSLSFASLELNSLPHSSPLEWKVLAEVIWTTGVIIKETKSIRKNMVNIATSHQPLTSELMRLLPLKQKSICKISSALMAHSCICSNICGAKLVFMAVINFRAPSPHLTLSLLLLLPLLPTVFTTVIWWQWLFLSSMVPCLHLHPGIGVDHPLHLLEQSFFHWRCLVQKCGKKCQANIEENPEKYKWLQQ